PESAGTVRAWRALFAYPYADRTPEHFREAVRRKHETIARKGDAYPAWVLDRMGVEVMLANRVTMGRGIAPPRFLWVPYADALMFPLSNTTLIARAPDYKNIFA